MRRRGPGSLRGTLAGLVVALAVVLAVLIVVAILGMVTTARDYREGAQTALTRQSTANALLIDLLSAQSANRAYILLAQGPDLRAYTAARDRYPLEMGRLREVLGDEHRLAPRPARSTAPPGCGSRRRWSSSACAARPRAQAERRIEPGSPRTASTPSAPSTPGCCRRSKRSARRPRRQRPPSPPRRSTRSSRRLLTLLMVAIASRQVWRRVGGPVALLSEGVGRVTRGRLTDPITAERRRGPRARRADGGFNLMQREVRVERDAVAAAARREAAQRTERDLWETVRTASCPPPPRRPRPAPGRALPAGRAALCGRRLLRPRGPCRATSP